jgi:hypothetical protein
VKSVRILSEEEIFGSGLMNCLVHELMLGCSYVKRKSCWYCQFPVV